MKSIFALLLNLAKKIKTSLQTANAYTDTKLSVKQIIPTSVNAKVENIFCYQIDRLTWVTCHLKVGVADQTTLCYGLPQPQGNGMTTLSAFCMNGTDLTRDFTSFIQNGRLEVRCSSASQGASGIIISGCYIAE